MTIDILMKTLFVQFVGCGSVQDGIHLRTILEYKESKSISRSIIPPFIQEALQIYLPILGLEHLTTQAVNSWLRAIERGIENGE